MKPWHSRALPETEYTAIVIVRRDHPQQARAAVDAVVIALLERALDEGRKVVAVRLVSRAGKTWWAVRAKDAEGDDRWVVERSDKYCCGRVIEAARRLFHVKVGLGQSRWAKSISSLPFKHLDPIMWDES
jgi:hypothetical protein